MKDLQERDASGKNVHTTATITVTVATVCACVRRVTMVKIVGCLLMKLCLTNALSIVLHTVSRLVRLCLRIRREIRRQRHMIVIINVLSLVWKSVSRVGCLDLSVPQCSSERFEREKKKMVLIMFCFFFFF